VGVKAVACVWNAGWAVHVVWGGGGGAVGGECMAWNFTSGSHGQEMGGWGGVRRECGVAWYRCTRHKPV